MKEIHVFAPATIANVGSGFDIFGFALNRPGDEVRVRFSDEPGATIGKIVGDKGVLSVDHRDNTASVAVQAFLDHLKEKRGIEIDLYKKMPVGSGLGSSAASAVAALYAANALLGSPLERHGLLPFAVEAERISCGAAHADNVAPSLMGGFVLIRSYHPLDIVRIPTPEDMHCAIVHPSIRVETREARKMLATHIPLHDATAQWGNAAALIAGLMKGDFELIGKAVEDRVAEPVRSALIPGFADIKRAAYDAGAFGCSIAGSGPSVFALSASYKDAEKIGAAMLEALVRTGTAGTVYLSKVNEKGPKIIEER